MKKLSVILTLLLPLTAFASCSDSNEPEVSDNPASSELGGDTKTLVAYFSAEGHTQAVAEAISRETGCDIFFIEPAIPYSKNPYDDSEKIQNEAYNDLRPEVKTYLSESQIEKYDTIFVGTPCWWHQPRW